ncbi:MAG: hypothetical protein M3421_13545 [Bacteroidota bacterium]|nr:hypothetical protein [Bacteroidota bacterium]
MNRLKFQNPLEILMCNEKTRKSLPLITNNPSIPVLISTESEEHLPENIDPIEILNLIYFERFSVTEISARYKISPGSIKLKLRKGIQVSVQ